MKGAEGGTAGEGSWGLTLAVSPGFRHGACGAPAAAGAAGRGGGGLPAEGAGAGSGSPVRGGGCRRFPSPRSVSGRCGDTAAVLGPGFHSGSVACGPREVLKPRFPVAGHAGSSAAAAMAAGLWALLLLVPLGAAVYEDQVGKFDW